MSHITIWLAFSIKRWEFGGEKYLYHVYKRDSSNRSVCKCFSCICVEQFQMEQTLVQVTTKYVVTTSINILCTSTCLYVYKCYILQLTFIVHLVEEYTILFYLIKQQISGSWFLF